MRSCRRRNRRSWTPETSRLAHAAKAAKRLLEPAERIGRPEPGLLLGVLRWENCQAGHSTEIRIFQARRLNQIEIEVFGRRSRPHGWDWLMRHLRKRGVVRWLRD